MAKKKSKSKSKPQTLSSPSPRPPSQSLKPIKTKSKSKKSKKSKTLDETLTATRAAIIDYDSESSLSPSQKLLKLIAPFPKDHLITLLSTFAITSPKLLDQIRIAADVNVCHRRLFVYGIEGAVGEEDLRRVFGEYGELEDCHVVVDRETGLKKGYGFVRFRERRAAALALRERIKRVGNGRVVQCVLAAAGVGGGGGGVVGVVGTRKIYISHVPKDTDPLKLSAFFRKFGDIEEGPLGFDYKTGKSRGFAIFVYRTVEGARKALEEPLKIFEGHQLYCKKHEEVKKKDTVVPTAPAGAPQQMLPPKTQEASSSFPHSMLPKTVQDVPPQTVQAQASPLVSAQGLPPGTGQAAPQQAMHGLSHVYPAPSHVAHPPVPSHAVHPPQQLLAAVAAAQNLAMYNHNPGLVTYYGGMLGAASHSPYFPGRVDGMAGGSYGASQAYGYSGGYGDSRYGDYGSYSASTKPFELQNNYPKDQLGKYTRTFTGPFRPHAR
ncbi:UBP1-associated protein 2B-like protein [Drosera capensis]